MTIKVKLDPGAYIPARAYDTDAGFDLKTPIDFIVPAGGSATVDTGVHMLIPDGYCGLLVSKSGLNTKKSITSTGLVDAGYTGSIVVKLYNHDKGREQTFHVGDKISQITILPIAAIYGLDVVTDLEETPRGSNGFGSTGA